MCIGDNLIHSRAIFANIPPVPPPAPARVRVARTRGEGGGGGGEDAMVHAKTIILVVNETKKKLTPYMCR